MSAHNDRVNYYERQYLRSYDFAAEQLYHIEMRRRLNMALHLWGIVDGLALLQSPPLPGEPDEFYISAGMAIDGYGREIVLAQPYPLTGADLRHNRIASPGLGTREYFLSIAYRRELTNPPAAGYRLCDVKDQYTRWEESFEIVIRANYQKRQDLGVADPLSDDPVSHEWLVPLGKIVVGPNSQIQGAFHQDREYIAVRAQRVRAPVASLASGTTDSARPISVEADLFAEKNLAIGADFFVDTAKVLPAPTSTPFPSTQGNVKVETNLFVQGDVYKYISGTDQWLELRKYFSQVVPNIEIGTKTLPAAATGVDTIPVTTTLATVSGVPRMIAAISSVKGQNKANLGTWNTNLTGTSANEPWILEVAVGAATQAAGLANVWNFPITWKVGPTAPSGLIGLPIQEIVISYVAVFLP